MVEDVESEAVVRLEPQLAFLARALEAISRKRSYPLERAHYLMLLCLRGQPRSSGELAAELVLEHSTVTRQIAAMQQRGLVGKLSNPADGRSTLIRATEKGLELCDSMRRVRQERIEVLLADWTESERETLAQMLGRLNLSLIGLLETFGT